MKYIVLGNWTAKGRETLPGTKKRIETSKKIIESYQGTMELYFTMGEYDFIAIMDIPDEESMAKLLLKLNKLQNFTTKTLRAWPDSEFVEIVSEILY